MRTLREWMHRLAGMFRPDRPLRVRAVRVDEHLLAALALQPAQGRFFVARETDAPNGEPAAPPIAILSHELWQTAFGGQSLVGRTVPIDGRAHEIIGIGIRVALGAGRSTVLAHVMTQGLIPAGIGLSVGLAAAFGVNRLVASLLFGVEPTDPATFAGVVVAMAAVAGVACWLPAWRASRLNPIPVLRAE
jgi:hypothetical protein